MKKISTILGLSVLCSLPTLHGALAADLTEVLVHTYNTNPALLAERETLKATDEQYNQAFSGWLPSANLSASREHNTVKTARPPSQSDIGNSREFAITQQVFNGGETIAQMNRAKNQIKAAQETLKRIEQTVFLEAITAYMDVIRTEETLKLSQQNLEVLKRNRGSTDERFRLGEVTRTDVSQSSARVSRAITEQTRALGEATIARATFLNVTGMEPLALTIPSEAKNIPENIDTALTLALQHNPVLKAAEYTTLAAKSTVSASKAAQLPDVSLRGDIRETDGYINLGGSDYDTKTLSLNLTIPLYQTGAEYSRIRANKNTLERRRFDAETASRDVVETTVRSWQNLEVARATLISSHDAVIAATTAVEGVTQETEVGSRTVIDLLDAQQELFSAQISEVRARSERVIGSYSLKSALGELTAAGLELPVDVYNPKVHLNKTK